MNPQVIDIACAVHQAGGQALIVGGYVRDRLLGIESKDIDIEVFGLDLPALERLLSRYGSIYTAGRSFGVVRIKSLDIDFSLPRRDHKVAPGHRGFAVEFDPGLDFSQAARRRDFTINSIGLDPLTGEIIDPHDGRGDLRTRTLRSTDSSRFAEDPLRGLRAAQFIARFSLAADAELLRLCASLDLGELPPARVGEEFRKLLLLGHRPSQGLDFLCRTDLLRFFPEIAALKSVPQDPEWHPEGDVWTHTLMVLDAASQLRNADKDSDLLLMLGALCHDFGKPQTTVEIDGRVRSPGHDDAGVEPTVEFLTRLNLPRQKQRQVTALVRYHLVPTLFVKQGTGARGYRRLARKLSAADVSPELLLRVAKADHLGRTTSEAKAGVFSAEDPFRQAMSEYLVSGRPPPPVVTGYHLLEYGLAPGPSLGECLAECELIQDETGWDDPQRIIAAVLERKLAPLPVEEEMK